MEIKIQFIAMKLEKSQNWPGWKEAVPYGTIFDHKQWHAPNCRFERTKVSVPRVILDCASPLASLDLSGSGQRGRELQLMIEPHWFLFVHHNKVFMLQITDVCNWEYRMLSQYFFTFGILYWFHTYISGDDVGEEHGLGFGDVAWLPLTFHLDYRLSATAN